MSCPVSVIEQLSGAKSGKSFPKAMELRGISMIKHTFKVPVWFSSFSVLFAFRLEYNAGKAYKYLRNRGNRNHK